MFEIDPKIMKENLPLSTMSIVNQAQKRGISYEILFPRAIVLLSYRGHDEYLFFQSSSKTTYVAGRICRDKSITKYFLERAGIETPRGQLYGQSQKDEALEFARQIGWPVVLKPYQGERGKQVFSDVRDETSFLEKWATFDETEKIIIETKFIGKEYRVWATQNGVFGITNRVPANVIGDGISTIETLIEEKNEDEKRGINLEPKPLKKIKIDEEVLSILAKSDRTLESIPKEGEQVFLRANSNLSTGGDSIESLDVAHQSVKDIAIKAINSIPGLAYAGVDFMTTDITKPQTKGTYAIIELNEVPGIDGHHFPAVGKPRNVAAAIIDLLFPEVSKS